MQATTGNFCESLNSKEKKYIKFHSISNNTQGIERITHTITKQNININSKIIRYSLEMFSFSIFVFPFYSLSFSLIYIYKL